MEPERRHLPGDDHVEGRDRDPGKQPDGEDDEVHVPPRDDGAQSDVERLRTVVRLANDLGINLAGIEVILRLSQQIEELQRELAATRAERDEARAMLGGRRPSAAGGREDGDRR